MLVYDGNFRGGYVFTRVYLPLLTITLLATQFASPADDSEDKLFTRYFSITAPIFKSNIPGKTCQQLLIQADRIYQASVADAVLEASKNLQSKTNAQLQIAGENLRSCATNDSLTRRDRDTAVDLYVWIRIEQNRREQFQK